MNKVVLKFAPGGDWLYIRIYGGPAALEEWLTGAFTILHGNWKSSGLVRYFHFVHFLDPEYHLRIRFLLNDPVHSGILLTDLARTCQDLLIEDLIWKIEVGTYEPEYERYGESRMSLVERWFDQDSQYWLDELSVQNNRDEPETWKCAIRSIDVFLEDFGASMEEKACITNRLRESATSFFSVNRAMKGQLDDKYRKAAPEISRLMGDGHPKSDLLARRSDHSTGIIKGIMDTFNDRESLMTSDLLPDLIHMSMNRAFRTRHRLQELVVYDFLNRYYESMKAKEKNVKRDS